MVLSVPKPSKIPGSSSIRPPTLQQTVGPSPLIQFTAVLSTSAPLYLRPMVGLMYGCLPLLLCGSAARWFYSCPASTCFPATLGSEVPVAVHKELVYGATSNTGLCTFDRLRNLQLDISCKELKNPWTRLSFLPQQWSGRPVWSDITPPRDKKLLKSMTMTEN